VVCRDDLRHDSIVLACCSSSCEVLACARAFTIAGIDPVLVHYDGIRLFSDLAVARGRSLPRATCLAGLGLLVWRRHCYLSSLAPGVLARSTRGRSDAIRDVRRAAPRLPERSSPSASSRYGQQLWLCELVLAETTAVAWKHRFGDLQSDASKRQSPISAIAPPAFIANNYSQELVIANSHGCSEDVNRATQTLV
jgi:hypothetical protein